MKSSPIMKSDSFIHLPPSLLLISLFQSKFEYGLCTAIQLGDLGHVQEILTEHLELVNQLSNDPQPQSSASEYGRQRPIVCAAKYGRYNIARRLIDAGADVNAGVPLWSPQGHALFEACSHAEMESSGNCFSIIPHADEAAERRLHKLLIAHGGVPPVKE
jgi:hypothetical protein